MQAFFFPFHNFIVSEVFVFSFLIYYALLSSKYTSNIFASTVCSKNVLIEKVPHLRSGDIMAKRWEICLKALLFNQDFSMHSLHNLCFHLTGNTFVFTIYNDLCYFMSPSGLLTYQKLSSLF